MIGAGDLPAGRRHAGVVSFLLGAGIATACLLLFFYSSGPCPALPPAAEFLASVTLPLALAPAPAPAAAVDDDVYGDLQPALAQVATENGMVIMTSVSEAWAAPGSLLDLFLESFRVGEGIEYLLSHLLIVAVDDGAFDRCKLVHRHCYRHRLPRADAGDVSAENTFMTKGYVELVWSKLKLQARILELGYSLTFTDVDVMWFRNPLKHITVYADLTLACDYSGGGPDNLDTNSPNTGLFYAQANNRTAAAFRAWYESRERFGGHDQDGFNGIKHELVNILGLRVRYVDTGIFSGFCSYGKDLNKICTMHANCCIGLKKKVADLSNVVGEWKNYSSLPADVRRKGKFEWTRFGDCMRPKP